MVATRSRSAFKTIAEVAKELGLATHVLRFWETKFNQIKPMKASGGRRYYRPDDIEVLKLIKNLLYQNRYTIEGAQNLIKHHGLKELLGADEIQKDFFTDEEGKEHDYAAVVEQKPVSVDLTAVEEAIFLLKELRQKLKP